MPSEQEVHQATKIARLARNALTRQINTQKYIIKKNETALAGLPQLINDIERQLSALDVTFGLHAIQLDPTRIKGRLTRNETQPKGALLRSALKWLYAVPCGTQQSQFAAAGANG